MKDARDPRCQQLNDTLRELQQLQGEPEPAPEPEETEDVSLPSAVGSGKSTLKFLEPKKFSGSEDSRPIDVFLDSAERWLK